MKLGLEGKTALVSGASRGIGLAISRALHGEGCNIALAARGREGLEAAAASMPNASVHLGDAVTDAKAIVEDAAEKWNGLDILICNVGSGASVQPGTEDETELRRMFDLNLYSALNMIAAARPRLTSGGAIVCISSICGLAALGAPVGYSAAKAALNAAIKSLMRPLAAQGLRINAIAPGNILFEGSTWDRKLKDDKAGVEAMLAREVALGRLGTPDEIASLAVFLASPRAAFITGSVYVADGGQLR